MPTRDQVQELLDRGHTYEMVARELGIPAGRAYMIATGQPADGGPAPRPPGDQAGFDGSPQQLVNPPAFNPTRNARVMDWVKQRAARELTGSS